MTWLSNSRIWPRWTNRLWCSRGRWPLRHQLCNILQHPWGRDLGGYFQNSLFQLSTDRCGHSTTVASVCLCFYCSAKHPAHSCFRLFSAIGQLRYNSSGFPTTTDSSTRTTGEEGLFDLAHWAHLLQAAPYNSMVRQPPAISSVNYAIPPQSSATTGPYLVPQNGQSTNAPATSYSSNASVSSYFLFSISPPVPPRLNKLYKLLK